MEKQNIGLIVFCLYYVLNTSTNSQNIPIEDESVVAPFQGDNCFWLSISSIGFYLGVKLYKCFRRKLFIHPSIMFFLISMINVVGSTILVKSNADEILDQSLFLQFTLAKLIQGISQMMALLETVLLLRFQNNEKTKRWLYFMFPIFQLLGFLFSQYNFSETYAFWTSVINVSILSLYIFFHFKNKILIDKNKKICQLLKYRMMEDNQNCSDSISKVYSEIKFMYLLVLLFISTTLDCTYLVKSKILIVLIFLTSLHVFFFQIINVKFALILGQVIILIGLTITFFNPSNGQILVWGGYQVGIGSSQYYIIQNELSPLQIIDYFETYSIFQLLLASINSSYISNTVRFYTTNIGLRLAITLISTIVMIKVLQKSKIEAVDSKKQLKQEKEVNIDEDHENKRLDINEEEQENKQKQMKEE